MTVTAQGHPTSRPVATVSVASIAWVGAAAIFVGLRVAITWQAPVGGSELAHLSGAWNASIGVADDRFIPTLFQALASWLFELTSSPVPGRVLAFAATATVPVAVYLLRPCLGNAGALLALLVLAFDPVGAWLGVAATAAGFDLAITAWLLVALARPGTSPFAGTALAFLTASAGPSPLILGFAAAVVALALREYPSPSRLVLPGIAVVAAVALASVGFGRGWEGQTIPAFAYFGAMFVGDWSTATVADLTVLYSWPILAAGGIAAILAIADVHGRPKSLRSNDGFIVLMAAWAGIGMILLLASLTAHAEAPVVVASFPAALLAGPLLARAVRAIASVSNPLAWLTVALVLFTLVLAGGILTDWARLERVGPANEIGRVAIYATAALFLCAGLLRFRSPAPLLLVPVLLAGGLTVVSGAIAVGTSASSEPLPSPLSGGNVRALRAVALETAAERSGSIVVHVDLADDLVWPFRDSGAVTVTTEVPPDAAFVIWPARLPSPAGLAPVPGPWSLVEQVAPPTGRTLRLLHWVVERHLAAPVPVEVAVYVRPGQ